MAGCSQEQGSKGKVAKPSNDGPAWNAGAPPPRLLPRLLAKKNGRVPNVATWIREALQGICKDSRQKGLAVSKGPAVQRRISKRPRKANGLPWKKRDPNDVDMEADGPSEEGPDTNPEWASLDISQLKQEGHRLEKPHRELVETKCSAATEHVQAKLSLLKACLRSRWAISQRLDSLAAALKETQKTMQGLEAKETDLMAQLEATRAKMLQTAEEETDLTRQLDEAKREVVADTQLDTTQPVLSVSAAEDLAKKTTGAIQTCLSGVPGLQAFPEVLSAIGLAVQSVMSSVVHPVPCPEEPPSKQDALPETQKASEQQLQVALSKEGTEASEPSVVPASFGPCEKHTSRPEPYGKRP